MVRWEKLQPWRHSIAFINPSPSFLGPNELLEIDGVTLFVRNVLTNERKEWMTIPIRSHYGSAISLCSETMAIRGDNLVLLRWDTGNKYSLFSFNSKDTVDTRRVVLADEIESRGRSSLFLVGDSMHIIFTDDGYTESFACHFMYRLSTRYHGSTPWLEPGFKVNRPSRLLDHWEDRPAHQSGFVCIPSMQSIIRIHCVSRTIGFEIFSLQTLEWKRIPIKVERGYRDWTYALTLNEEFIIIFVDRRWGDSQRITKSPIFILELAETTLWLSTISWKPQGNSIAKAMNGIDGKTVDLILSLWARASGMNIPLDVGHLIYRMCLREYIHLWQGRDVNKNHCRISLEDILLDKKPYDAD